MSEYVNEGIRERERERVCVYARACVCLHVWRN